MPRMLNAEISWEDESGVVYVLHAGDAVLKKVEMEQIADYDEYYRWGSRGKLFIVRPWRGTLVLTFDLSEPVERVKDAPPILLGTGTHLLEDNHGE